MKDCADDGTDNGATTVTATGVTAVDVIVVVDDDVVVASSLLQQL